MEAIDASCDRTQWGQLYEVEVDAIFGLSYDDTHDSHTGPRLNCQDPQAVVVWCEQAYFVATSSAISSERTKLLNDQVSKERYASRSPPQALTHLGYDLGLSPVTITGGPTYIIPNNLHLPIAPAIDGAGLRIISSTSDDGILMAQHRVQRPSNWEPEEWMSLTEGRLGPWAMTIIHERAADAEPGDTPFETVCICFSARRTRRAAEAGIWTREDYRGKRLAAAVVATWATAERSHKEILFYSTSSDNLASQSVARQLQLQPFGWLWKLHA